MIRASVLGLVLVILATFSQFPGSVAQGQSNFVGTWKLSLDFSPGPILEYGVIAKASEGYKADQDGPQPLTTLGNGLVIGPCSSGPAGRVMGLAWRHLPLSGSAATGVDFTFEFTSGRTPFTVIIRSDFPAQGNRITGQAVVIGDTTDPTRVTPPTVFDTVIGREVNLIPFTLERVEQFQCGLITVP